MFHIKTFILLTTLVFSTETYAENWDFLVLEDNYAIGVRGISKLGDGEFAQYMQLNMLEGFMPKGRDLGYPRMVGSRVRHILFKCDTENALLTGVWVRDVEQNIIEKTEASSLDAFPPIARKGDSAVDRAINYACGDKTAKIAQPRKSAKSPPKDLITLVCHFKDSDSDHVFQVSYSEKTVDGLLAMIDETSITFSRQGADDVFVTRINRVTGEFNVERGKDGFSLAGSCTPQTKPKF